MVRNLHADWCQVHGRTVCGGAFCLPRRRGQRTSFSMNRLFDGSPGPGPQSPVPFPAAPSRLECSRPRVTRCAAISGTAAPAAAPAFAACLPTLRVAAGLLSVCGRDFRPGPTLTDGVAGFLSGVPLDCLRMWDRDD